MFMDFLGEPAEKLGLFEHQAFHPTEKRGTKLAERKRRTNRDERDAVTIPELGERIQSKLFRMTMAAQASTVISCQRPQEELRNVQIRFRRDSIFARGTYDKWFR